MKKCVQCSEDFQIFPEDQEFYRKTNVPEPTHCPSCRMQRRMVWRNERKMYHRTCDLCKKRIISMYDAKVQFPVYCPDCWWSDKWDPLEYGRDFDFTRSFFDQFNDLCNQVPHFSLAVLSSTMENSDYCNHAGWLKNCYLLVNSDESEQCLYGKGVNRCFDSVDSFKIYDCQGCYECLNCTNCSFCTFLVDSHNSDECHFSENLIGCKNCFGCVNLRNKSHHFFNKKLSPEKYREEVSKIKKEKSLQGIWQGFQKFRSEHFMKWMQEKNTENSTGDYLVQTKNCFSCFDCEYLENSRYCSDLKKGDKVSFGNYDVTYFGMGIDESYECSVGGYNAYRTFFCENVWESHDIYYSQICPQGASYLFGCIGMRHKDHCILNKQYTKEEYKKLVPKIIEHMKQTREWGEFFPQHLSPFGYNETTAHEYFPLTQEEVLQKGWKWKEEEETNFSDVTQKIPAQKLPESIVNIPDNILNWAIECEKTGKLFKIQKSELEFYRKMNLPVPHLHPDARHKRRMVLRNSRKLYSGTCDKCQKGIQTTYPPSSRIVGLRRTGSPTRSKTVYCEECYLAEVS